MSQNVELVKRVLSRLNDRDLDGALADVARDAELDWSRSEALDSGVYHGHMGWRKWMAGRWDELSEVNFDPIELIDAGPDMKAKSCPDGGRFPRGANQDRTGDLLLQSRVTAGRRSRLSEPRVEDRERTPSRKHLWFERIRPPSPNTERVGNFSRGAS